MSPAIARKKLALLDDDPVVCEVLSARIVAACPEIEVFAVNEPVVAPGFDVYVIDNSFGGTKEGSRLAEAISVIAPDAALFIVSSHLEVDLLKRALGSKCQGAFDKGNPAEIVMLVDAISEFVAGMEVHARQKSARGGILGEIAWLIREWNARIDVEDERRRSASPGASDHPQPSDYARAR